MSASFDRVIEALDRAGCLPAHVDGRNNGRMQLMVRCPAHEDHSPSLSVKHEGDRTLVHCFAGCETERVVDVLGLALADLYDRRRNTTTRAPTTQADELTAMLGLGSGRPSIKGARIFGRGAAASADLYLSDGVTVKFDSLADFTTPKRLATEVIVATGAACPLLTLPDVMKALALLHDLAEHVEAGDLDDDAIEWGLVYLQGANVVTVEMGDARQRWGAFEKLNEDRSRGLNMVLEDLDGTRYVRTGWFFEHVRRSDWGAGNNAQIATRMERVGWTRKGKRGRIKATRHGVELQHSFFTVPAAWESGQEASE